MTTLLYIQFWSTVGENCCFLSLIKYWSGERNTRDTMSDLHFDEESDYSEENNSDKEDFSSIFQPFQFEPQQRKNL